VFWENLRANFIPYLLAFVASICWGLYSNLSRRWAGRTEIGAVPIFLLSTGVVLMVVRVFFPEETRLTFHIALELLYTAIFPTLLAYTFWDTAMRKGRIVLVAALSYFIPVLSTVINCLVLKVVVGLHVWIACILVITGAVICRFSIIDETIT
jgi:drug/metabolite transporter (DMT)-like permease